ncbi:DUF4227 family protein [Paenibacillus larvae]|nr:DUF4227 family protein [Paenibacillus larvae]MDT2264912.1 DUF4227 family protein [Paenibacillus larvae]
MYQALRICSVWIEPIHKYKEPDGESVKAFSQFKDQTEPVRMLDRLRFLLVWRMTGASRNLVLTC